MLHRVLPSAWVTGRNSYSYLYKNLEAGQVFLPTFCSRYHQWHHLLPSVTYDFPTPLHWGLTQKPWLTPAKINWVCILGMQSRHLVYRYIQFQITVPDCFYCCADFTVIKIYLSCFFTPEYINWLSIIISGTSTTELWRTVFISLIKNRQKRLFKQSKWQQTFHSLALTD